MPRKSNLQLLQEALAKGDVPRAQELASKLDKMGERGKTPRKAPRRLAKAPVAEEAPEPTPKEERPPKAKREPLKRGGRACNDTEESSYIASTRPPGWSPDDFGGRKFIGADGKEHTYARRVSLEGVKFDNKFKPEEYKDLNTREKKLENRIKKLKSVPRPGQSGAQREPAKKVDVRCIICHNIVKVYPWEAETVDGESNFRCSKKSCVKAR